MIKIFLYFFYKCVTQRRNSYIPLPFIGAIKVLNTSNKTKKNTEFEKIKYKLLNNNRIINVTDFGAGSKLKKNNNRKISYIAKTSLTKAKYCILLRELINSSNTKKILELGTSFGITTLYMKSAKTNPEIITIEGDKNIANIAKKNFSKFNYNIELINANFDDILQQNNFKNQVFDFVFIDGNHKKTATIKYFNFIEKKLSKYGIVVFDDIRWSKGMFDAWTEIFTKKKTGFFLDLLKMGIYFKDDSIKKQISYKFF